MMDNYDSTRKLNELLAQGRSKQGAQEVLMRIVTRLLTEMTGLYEAGFDAFEPDDASKENIRENASRLWEAFDSAELLPVNRDLHYAKRDKRFQHFMSSITQAEGSES